MATSARQLGRLSAELKSAVDAKKCWRCGCFHDAINTLKGSAMLDDPVHVLLEEASGRIEQKRYDCLGCEVCWPAVAQNLAAEIDPAMAEGQHCASAAPESREGWPPLPGDYRVVRFGAPVAVCTLNSDHLIDELGGAGIDGLSIVGGLHTENLGIERLIRNTLANPHVRFLLVCGEDTRKAIGHLPGQALAALIQCGVDDKMRIIGAKGKRPLLKNTEASHVEAFRDQVQLIEQIGNTDVTTLTSFIAAAASSDPGPFADTPADTELVPVESARDAETLVLDPAGYFIVYPDPARRSLMLEHYSNRGVLERAFRGTSAAALYTSAISAGLVSRLDHAAYLGRELARAERALQNGQRYVQDRAPGNVAPQASAPRKDAGAACACHSSDGDTCH